MDGWVCILMVKRKRSDLTINTCETSLSLVTLVGWWGVVGFIPSVGWLVDFVPSGWMDGWVGLYFNGKKETRNLQFTSVGHLSCHYPSLSQGHSIIYNYIIVYTFYHSHCQSPFHLYIVLYH